MAMLRCAYSFFHLILYIIHEDVKQCVENGWSIVQVDGLVSGWVRFLKYLVSNQTEVKFSY